MKNYRLLFIVVILSLGLATTGFAAEKQVAKVKETPKAQEALTAEKGVKGMTKEELVKGIGQMFGYSRSLVGVVPGVEAVTDEKGGVSYVYKEKDGKTVKLEELPKETLEMMFLKVKNEMTRLTTEQTMKQLKEIRRIQEMERQRRALKPAVSPTRTTTTYKAPSLPKTYTAPKVYAPKSVPKAPSTRTRATTR